ncbi:MAG: hypothetical protein J6S85_10750 [Methanobrevibacter sp.]|nr:hypothetical protein [Methanobrevibacter sp.]
MENVFWVDIKGHQYQANEINNNYLTNIIKALPRGIGSKSFITPSKLKAVYDEAHARKLLPMEEIDRLYNESLDKWDHLNYISSLFKKGE